MKFVVALTSLFVGTALLVSCGKPAPTVREQEAAQARSVASLSGWDRLFAAPQETIGAINQAGFALGGYAAKGEGFIATGQPRMFSNSNAKAPNTTSVVVAGRSAAAGERQGKHSPLTDAPA